MHALCNYADKELKELEHKAESTDNLSEREVEYAKNLAKLKMALLTNEAMERDGYSNYYPRYVYDDASMARGRTGNVRRDSMGRYSRDEAEDELMEKLRAYMQETDSPEKKQEIKRFMKKLGEM